MKLAVIALADLRVRSVDSQRRIIRKIDNAIAGAASSGDRECCAAARDFEASRRTC